MWPTTYRHHHRFLRLDHEGKCEHLQANSDDKTEQTASFQFLWANGSSNRAGQNRPNAPELSGRYVRPVGPTWRGHCGRSLSRHAMYSTRIAVRLQRAVGLPSRSSCRASNLNLAHASGRIISGFSNPRIPWIEVSKSTTQPETRVTHLSSCFVVPGFKNVASPERPPPTTNKDIAAHPLRMC